MGVIYFLFFLLVIFFCFYVPGSVLLSKFKIKGGPLGIVEWIFGSAVFILLSYFFAWLRIPWILIVITFVFSLFFLKNYRNNLSFVLKPWKEVDKYSLLIIILGSLAFTSVMFFSGWEDSSGIQFRYVNAVDGIRHVAYIKNQIDFFPPQQPGLAGVEVRGFHYFYDFMLSRFALFFNFSVEDLYFRLFPFLVSIFYGGAFLFLTNKFTKNLFAQRLILFFVYFGQSLSIIYLFLAKNVNLTESTVVQPMGLIVNPFTVYAIAIFVTGMALIPEIKHNTKAVILIGITFGILSQIKIYAGVPGAILLASYTIYNIAKYKRKYLVQVLLMDFIAAVITVFTYFPNNLGAGGLLFNPFLIMREYMQRPLFEGLHWELKRQVFVQYDNYLRIFLLYIQMIIIYFAVNFGIKILPVLKLKMIFQKTFWKNEYNFLLFAGIFTFIFLGSLFIQTVSVFDTIQFFWIAIPLLSIPTGIIIVGYLNKLSNSKFRWILLGLIVVTTIPGNLDILSKYLSKDRAIIISSPQLDLYKKINALTRPQDFLVYLPEKAILEDDGSEGNGTPIISALTGRAIYWEGGNIPSKHGGDFVEERKIKLLALDAYLKECDILKVKNTLVDIGSNNLITSNHYSCLENNYKIVQNRGSKLYYVKIGI